MISPLGGSVNPLASHGENQPQTSNSLTFLLCYTNLFASSLKVAMTPRAKSQKGRCLLPESQEGKPLLFIKKRKERKRKKQVYPLKLMADSLNHAKIHDTGSGRNKTSMTIEPQPLHWTPIVITKGKKSLYEKSRADMMTLSAKENKEVTDTSCRGRR